MGWGLRYEWREPFVQQIVAQLQELKGSLPTVEEIEKELGNGW